MPRAASGETTPIERRARSARDRLLDLIGVGETAPMQDLPARVEPPMVTFGGAAQLLVEDSQIGVVYDLRDKDGDPRVPPDVPLEGTGATIAFPLAEVEHPTTFAVLARKLPGTGEPPLSGRSAMLHPRPTVNVGLATGLAAWIGSGPSERPPLIDYAAVVEVTIENSQSGVDYRLVGHPPGAPADPTDLGELTGETVISAQPWTRGDGGPIVLQSVPLRADTLIRVRCVKQFEGGDRQTQLLLRELPVLVRADPGRAVRRVPAGPVAHGATPSLRFDAAEPSVAYRLHLRPVREAEFRPGATGPDLLEVPAESGEVVAVSAPGLPADWPNPAGYAAHGGYSGTGGGSVNLRLPALLDDTLVIVEARKTHDPAIAGAAMQSTLALTTTPVFLVRPDPRPALRLVLPPGATGTAGPIVVEGGQPGTAYGFRIAPSGPDLPLPAYIHRRDETNARLNKGIDQLWLGIDFVVAADPLGPPSAEPAAKRRPAPPRLDAPEMPFGTELEVTARKVRTGVTTPLAEPVRLAAPPEMAPRAETVARGKAAHVLVTASRPEDRHTLLIDGVAQRPVAGTGGDLELVSPPLDVDALVVAQVWDATAATAVVWAKGFPIAVTEGPR